MIAKTVLILAAGVMILAFVRWHWRIRAQAKAMRAAPGEGEAAFGTGGPVTDAGAFREFCRAESILLLRVTGLCLVALMAVRLLG